MPASADPVTVDAYSHEVVAFGFWAGDERQTPYPAFSSYTATEPAGLADRPLEPGAASRQDTGNGHLAVLAYDAVRESGDPRATLPAFYESAYRAGAGAAGSPAGSRRPPADPSRVRSAQTRVQTLVFGACSRSTAPQFRQTGRAETPHPPMPGCPRPHSST